MMLKRYTINHVFNARGEPVTEILDHKRGTASRFLGVYTDESAMATLEYYRRECAANAPRFFRWSEPQDATKW